MRLAVTTFSVDDGNILSQYIPIPVLLKNCVGGQLILHQYQYNVIFSTLPILGTYK